uniref:Uncharacterized protein n=1 Tax=uncultured marine crenarchaeote HF4000_APKG5B22 TaxID=455590 RepID=B3T885_9ARCH|nr:hypothetical protein ALOHA_HF4000APKG5B22ctg2g32 [uncultured marine crenarchaeote HF4000_APKG5B22]
MIQMIPNSPRCVTWALPGFRAKRRHRLIPMTFCESEPGNILLAKI